MQLYFFYLSTSRILTFAGELSDRTNVKVRLVDGQSPAGIRADARTLNEK